MKNWLQTLCLSAWLVGSVLGNEVELVCFLRLYREFCFAKTSSDFLLQKQDDAHRQRCSGMYSRKDWGGDVDPFISVRFSREKVTGDEDPLVSLIIFEWNDEALIGRATTEDAEV